MDWLIAGSRMVSDSKCFVSCLAFHADHISVRGTSEAAVGARQARGDVYVIHHALGKSA